MNSAGEELYLCGRTVRTCVARGDEAFTFWSHCNIVPAITNFPTETSHYDNACDE